MRSRWGSNVQIGKGYLKVDGKFYADDYPSRMHIFVKEGVPTELPPRRFQQTNFLCTECNLRAYRYTISFGYLCYHHFTEKLALVRQPPNTPPPPRHLPT